MAAFQVAPPEKFDFSNPEGWTKWIRRFERFREASGLSARSQENQVNTLIYTMGDEGDDILSSFGLGEDDKKNYDTVKEKFQGYFIKKHNVIFERAKFNMRSQLEGETIDSFVTALHGLAEHCNYRDLKEELIRDRMVVGLRDAALSEKLQMDPDLTLEKAVTIARQKEAVKKQQPLIRGDSRETNLSKDDLVPTNVDSVRNPNKRAGFQPTGSHKFSHKQASASPSQRRPSTQCYRCGGAFQRGHQCPAANAICHKCNRRGHFQEFCRSTYRVQEILDDESTQEEAQGTAFLGAVQERGIEINQPWRITISVNETPVVFKVDTGADVTVIPSSMVNADDLNVQLAPCSKQLCGPGNKTLSVDGQFRAHLTYKERSTVETIIVVSGLQMPLLGRPAISQLHLIQRLDTLCAQNNDPWPLVEYPQLFTGLGKLQGDYTIKLKPDATPHALLAPRHVPIPLLPKVKAELERMQSLGVITPVEEATDWCAGMVVVPKTSGEVRICVDLTKLNESVCREIHPMPSVDHTLGQLAGAKWFSKLDANSGFWQIPLSQESSALTTFITPFGRFRFNRLPFGITSAPEHFQRRIAAILGDLDGVAYQVDDILIHAKTKEEHDSILRKVLTRLSRENITLNREKCKFFQTKISFLGHTVDASGISPDPEKTRALQAMPPPSNPSEVRRFLGMANHLSKFLPDLANSTKPLRDLLSKNHQWIWDTPQKQSFEAIQAALTSPPVLALYDPNQYTIVSADASSYGLGAVLMQQQPDGHRQPVAFISRAMTQAEQMYAQIEKEALAITWACDRFNQYILGLRFHIETDHKPLVSLLGSKNLEELPLRVQRFRLRLMRYDFSISHVPGKDLIIADALSRAPDSGYKPQSSDLQQSEVEAYVDQIICSLPATEGRLEQIRREQQQDTVCQRLTQYCQQGWPSRDNLPGPFKPYLTIAAELSIKDNLLMRGRRIVVPAVLQKDILDRLHTGHQGITKCRQRARHSVWWLNISKQIEEMIRPPITSRPPMVQSWDRFVLLGSCNIPSCS